MDASSPRRAVVPKSVGLSVLDRFCRQVRQRSRENQEAFRLLMERRLHGAAMSLVRQELDSMIRVTYLLDSQDPDERAALIDASVRGKHWTRRSATGKRVRITDREMADLALRHHGWIRQVYEFGCNLIHLSDWHDYRDSDPTKNLDAPARTRMLTEIERFHRRHLGELSFSTLLMHAPYAITKIGENLECYIQSLERVCGEPPVLPKT